MRLKALDSLSAEAIVVEPKWTRTNELIRIGDRCVEVAKCVAHDNVHCHSLLIGQTVGVHASHRIGQFDVLSSSLCGSQELSRCKTGLDGGGIVRISGERQTLIDANQVTNDRLLMTRQLQKGAVDCQACQFEWVHVDLELVKDLQARTQFVSERRVLHTGIDSLVVARGGVGPVALSKCNESL